MSSSAAYNTPAPTGELGDIVLAGHFDPVAIKSLLSSDGATRLEGLSGPPAVPIHNLASGLANLGIRTTLLGGLRQAPEMYVPGEPVSVALYNKRESRTFLFTGFGRERKAALRLLEKLQPSLVHAHWTMEAARAVADWNGPKILTVHDAAYEYTRIGWKWHPGAIAYKARWLANTLAVFRRFDHVIAVSPFVETYLRLRHRFQGEIRVIPNAIPNLPRTIQVIDKFPKSGRVTFGAYGDPGALKNVEAAIEAFSIVEKQIPNSRLVIFGGGWAQSGTRNARRSVEMRGNLKHDRFLQSLASEIDIWVHPSRIEAHPMTICEAIQAGCPVIAGRASGGVPWTLGYGRAGLLVDIENPRELAEAMLALVRNRERAMSLVSSAREMVSARFNPGRVMDLHLQYYEDVIRQWRITHEKER